jgi:hypothetical protein
MKPTLLAILAIAAFSLSSCATKQPDAFDTALADAARSIMNDQSLPSGAARFQQGGAQ